jgi:hypothetical protein
MMTELNDELQTHVGSMILRLTKTLQDAAYMFDSEFHSILKAVRSIHSKKYPEIIKKMPTINEDVFFDKILDTLCKNHKDQHFSFEWLENLAQLEASAAPLTNDSAYHDAKKALLALGPTPTSWNQKIYFLATGIRFYLELQKNDTFSIDNDLPTMLRIDRALSYIREDIAAALATSKSRETTARPTTSTNIQTIINKIDGTKEVEQTFEEIKKSDGTKTITFNKLASRIFKVIPGDMCQKTIENLLKQHGITCNTMHGKTLSQISWHTK